MDWTKQFSEWLEQGKDGAEHLLDYPWDIELKDVPTDPPKDLIVASHPKIPFHIEIVVGKHFANLVINPIIPTDALETTERMRLYKKLLHLNTDLNLMKAGLVGYDDIPVIQVDLDLESLNKLEFNDALTLLIIGAHNMVKILGITTEMENFMLNRFKAIVTEKSQEGDSKETILEFLIERGGLDKNSAETIVSMTLKEMEADKETPLNEDDGPGPMYG